jgi:predicted MFS family arabinose efflux permease
MSHLLYGLLFSVCLIGSNGLLLSPLLSAISADLQAPIAHVSRAVAAYGAGSAISAIWLGRYLDGFGLNRALFWSMAFAGIAQLLSALSQDWISLTVLQMLAGAAAGIALPSIYGLATTVAPKGKEAQTLSRVTFGWSISLVASVPLAAYFADQIGWRFTIAAFGIFHLSMLLPLKIFRGPPTPAATKFSLLMPFKIKGSPSIYAINFLFMGCFYGIYAFSGSQAVSGFGQSTAEAGLIALIYGIGFGSGSFFAKYLDRTSPNIALPIGLLSATAGICAIAFSTSYTAYLIAFGFWGFLNHLILNLILTRITDLTTNHKGAVLSMYSGVTYIASMVSILGFGSLIETRGFVQIVLLAAGFQFCAFIIAMLWKKPISLQP